MEHPIELKYAHLNTPNLHRHHLVKVPAWSYQTLAACAQEVEARCEENNTMSHMYSITPVASTLNILFRFQPGLSDLSSLLPGGGGQMRGEHHDKPHSPQAYTEKQRWVCCYEKCVVG